MSAKLLASLNIVVGGLASILGLLAAFGIELSQNQSDAIVGIAGLILLLAGAWVHPAIPIGNKETP